MHEHVYVYVYVYNVQVECDNTSIADVYVKDLYQQVDEAGRDLSKYVCGRGIL